MCEPKVAIWPYTGLLTFVVRDFLLFIPAGVPSLRAVLTYYSATASVNQEGDVHINDTLQGFGKSSKLFRHLALLRFISSVYFCQPEQLLVFTSSGFCSLAMHFLILEWLVTILTDLFPAELGYFIAGGMAGMISRTTTAPLDRLKVYLIAQTSPKEAAVDAAKKGAPVAAIRHFAQPLRDACKELWRAGGIRSLFAGNGLNVVKVMPESAIKFGAYEAAKRFFANIDGSDPKHLHPTAQFLAGGFGGAVAQCMVYPLDTLKFRMQCETVQGGLRGNALITETAKKMWRQGKLGPFYRGLGMGLAGMFPYSAIDLLIFEKSKAFYLSRRAKDLRCHESDVTMSNVWTAAIGATSGAISATVVYPINLLRTRLQAQGTVLHQATYTGIVDVTQKTLRNEGFKGLFKGVTPNLLKVAPAVSISYVVYENSKRLMGLY
jgi:solute carrier family 25 (mitochondrial phosphate transporter), member 23/24/25/41